VDTAFFKGNFPDRCSIQGAHLDLVNLNSIESDSEAWQDLLPQVKLGPDREHEFTSEIIDIGSVTHIRLNIYPDGGVSRLRLFAELS
jgi:allantoicase